MGTRKRPVTEQRNARLNSLDTQSLAQLLRHINREDRKVAPAVARVLPQIAAAVEIIVPALAIGGRLVYLGAGTSGRLGVLDAAECIPTFGTDQVMAVLAGAPQAMFKPVEGAEDDPSLARRDLHRIKLSGRDVLVGISASGRTPYTVAGLRYARSVGAKTIAVAANPDVPISRIAHVAIVPVVGPEVVAGSTRMKAGTAQKLVLNMLSTASMIRLGRVFSNWMINVQLTNSKLRLRAQGILTEATGASAVKAARILKASGGRLPVALLMLSNNIPRKDAEQLLAEGSNTAAVLRRELGIGDGD
jgi:N-acetylmuramic acid 6-phosphate etherase